MSALTTAVGILTLVIGAVTVNAFTASLIGLGAVIVAVGLIWRSVLRPLVRAYVRGEQLAPLVERIAPIAPQLATILEGMVKDLEGTPQPFAVLNKIAAEFRTDSGSSLRDEINSLAAAVERLDDRLDGLADEVQAGAATGLRIESDARDVATDLAEKRGDT
jgi:hypothetical protein